MDVFLLVALAVVELQEAASAVAFEQQEDAGAACWLLTKVAGVDVLVLPVVFSPLAFWQALAQSAGWHWGLLAQTLAQASGLQLVPFWAQAFMQASTWSAVAVALAT
ncbi:MAG TPA: hypothetical protein PKC76_14045 [Saprospiraceae bacterium]|nr:hypothetical protein [Saprospiraceae bacterium]HMP25258.1 hypothetical protein [Saprospiraceae bacterium]